MRRREVIAIMGAAPVAWPPAARAQRPGTPVIGYLGTAAFNRDTMAIFVPPFGDGLKQGGYIAGRNVAMEYRWAEGRHELLPALAAELVAHKVAVIVAPTGAAAIAARKTTQNIPIVFLAGGDATAAGLVVRFSRPEGNATGVSILTGDLAPKRLELLRELIPGARSVALLVNPGTVALAPAQLADAQAAARAIGLEPRTVECRTAGDIEPAFARLAERRADALLVAPDPLFLEQRERIIALAARQPIATIYDRAEYVAAGGLISFGPSFRSGFRIMGQYTGKILGGARIAELPVQQPTKFELAINLKTAKALGLAVPATLIDRADEVIE